MNLDNVALTPGTQGLVAALIALQQANGVDFETALARVRASAENGPILVANVSWDQLVDMLRWFATPPPGPAGEAPAG